MTNYSSIVSAIKTALDAVYCKKSDYVSSEWLITYTDGSSETINVMVEDN